MTQELVEVNRQGQLVFHFHPGQIRAWDSTARVTAIIAGTQSGKTSFGPVWLWREIKMMGPGDYIVATPTFPLLEVKALPEFLKLFEETLKLGKYVKNPVKKFVFSEQGEVAMWGQKQTTPTNVYFGYAANPDSLESMTAKAAWLDEAGQKDFKVGSYEALQRRLAIADGRMLITTTPYDLGWLKTRVWNKRKDPKSGVKVIRFDSTENPQFPQDVMERARREMPGWKFNMFYRGIFARPAGMIYGNFNDDTHTCPRFALPESWKRYAGHDFGGNHTAGIWFAEDPATKKLYGYREYLAGEKTSRDHALAFMRGEITAPEAYGGAKSEEQWRAEFNAAGYRIRKPKVSEVEVGIDRVYGALERVDFVLFDDLQGTIDEFNTYSRELDDFGEPTEKIDDKAKYHRLDAVRYIIGSIRGQKRFTSIIYNPEPAGTFDPDADLAWGDRYISV